MPDESDSPLSTSEESGCESQASSGRIWRFAQLANAGWPSVVVKSGVIELSEPMSALGQSLTNCSA